MAYRNLPNGEGLFGKAIAVAVGTAIVSVEVTGLAPAGVTDVGEKAHVGIGAAPLTLQLSRTALANPFLAVTVMTLVPCPPNGIAMLAEAAVNEKSGLGPAEIVYVALETVLSKKPLATAIAWIVVVELTGMAAVYSVDDLVGVVPFVV